MAKDDYHVIVYQILAYLYQCLKKGEKVEGRNLEHNSQYFQVNREYWSYIMYNMDAQGFIEGVTYIQLNEGQKMVRRSTVWQEIEISRDGELYMYGRVENVLFNLKKQLLSRIEQIDLPELVIDRESKVGSFSKFRFDREEMDFVYKYRVAYSDLDKSRHMNNGRYVNLFVNAFDLAFMDSHFINSLEIQFDLQALCGEELSVYMKQEGDRYNMLALNQNKEKVAQCVLTITEKEN